MVFGSLQHTKQQPSLCYRVQGLTNGVTWIPMPTSPYTLVTTPQQKVQKKRVDVVSTLDNWQGNNKCLVAMQTLASPLKFMPVASGSVVGRTHLLLWLLTCVVMVAYMCSYVVCIQQ